MLRIVIIDDHKIVKDGIRAILEEQKNYKVVGEAANGEEALAVIENSKPDLILMDITMPVLNGLDLTRRLRQNGNSTKVLILTMHKELSYLKQALQAGANGYLLKNCSVNELNTAIQTVMDNRVFIGSDFTLCSLGTNSDFDIATNTSKRTQNLSLREREVLQLISEGASTRDVAKRLAVSIKTVETHRRKIMRKLDLFSVAELTKYAVRSGITPLNH